MTAADKHILRTFLRSPIPQLYKELDSCRAYTEYDLMVCHEEVFDYAHCMLHNKPVDLSHNFFGAPSVAICKDYIHFLQTVGQEHPGIQSFCQCQAAAVQVLLAPSITAGTSKKRLPLRSIAVIIGMLAIVMLAYIVEFDPFATSPSDYILTDVKHTDDAIIISGILINSSKQVTGVRCEWEGGDIKIVVQTSLIHHKPNAPFDGIGKYQVIVSYRPDTIGENDGIHIIAQGSSIFDRMEYEYTLSDQTFNKK